MVRGSRGIARDEPRGSRTRACPGGSRACDCPRRAACPGDRAGWSETRRGDRTRTRLRSPALPGIACARACARLRARAHAISGGAAIPRTRTHAPACARARDLRDSRGSRARAPAHTRPRVRAIPGGSPARARAHARARRARDLRATRIARTRACPGHARGCPVPGSRARVSRARPGQGGTPSGQGPAVCGTPPEHVPRTCSAARSAQRSHVLHSRGTQRESAAYPGHVPRAARYVSGTSTCPGGARARIREWGARITRPPITYSLFYSQLFPTHCVIHDALRHRVCLRGEGGGAQPGPRRGALGHGSGAGRARSGTQKAHPRHTEGTPGLDLDAQPCYPAQCWPVPSLVLWSGG